MKAKTETAAPRFNVVKTVKGRRYVRNERGFENGYLERLAAESWASILRLRAWEADRVDVEVVA